MNNQESSIVFDQQRASSYDTQFKKLDPIKEALHLLIRMVFADLPASARILCVGAGTGAELIYLAQAFPHFHFTAVEPAKPMLDICRQRAEESGVASRCTFHLGYLDSLPKSDSFDAATCLLVSHFFMKSEKRIDFLNQIAEKISPRGYLVSADLASNVTPSTGTDQFKLWLRAMAYTEIPAEEIEKMRVSLGRDVAVLSPQQVQSLIESSGFETPILFFQSILIHAWYSRRVC